MAAMRGFEIFTRNRKKARNKGWGYNRVDGKCLPQNRVSGFSENFYHYFFFEII